MTTMVELLAAIGTHVGAFEVPAVASVNVAAGMSDLAPDATTTIPLAKLGHAASIKEATA
jgi:hypothetical protein